MPENNDYSELRDPQATEKMVPRPPRSSSRLAIAGGAVGLLLVLAVALRQQGFDVKAFLDQIQSLVQESNGPAGAAVFVSVYALATVLLFPASVLTLGAGYIFGVVKGTAVVSAASTTGATLAFLISRYVARPLVEAKAAGYPRFRAIDRGVAAKGLNIVLLLRLSPLFPFSLLNYGLGLTKIPLLEYVFGSWVGMLPGTAAYVYFGSLGKAVVDASSSSDVTQAETGTKLVLYAVGAIAALGATKLISDTASNALNEPLAACDSEQQDHINSD